MRRREEILMTPLLPNSERVQPKLETTGTCGAGQRREQGSPRRRPAGQDLTAEKAREVFKNIKHLRCHRPDMLTQECQVLGHNRCHLKT